MKRHLLLLAFVAVCGLVNANQAGHFFLNVQDQNISLTDVEKQFEGLLAPVANSTFEVIRDVTDELGIRHLSYQQLVDGEAVYNAMVLVHAKNDKVFVVNGHIRTAENAEMGKMMRRKPVIWSADVPGTAHTMYSGVQPITCYEKDGKYWLMDEGRHIITLNSCNNPYEIDVERVKNATTEEEEDAITSEELTKLIDAAARVYSDTPDFDSSWDMQLQELSVESVEADPAWYTEGEGLPDLYFIVRDKDGNQLLKTERVDEAVTPTTFKLTPAVSVMNPPYVVELWDYDADGDDMITSFKIVEVGGENITFYRYRDLAIMSGTIRSEGIQPLFDAHWGMERTLDFYREKFNRDSYDGKGSIVYQIVNPKSDDYVMSGLPSNAFAYNVPPYPMIYGMGSTFSDPEWMSHSYGPMVAIDVMAHEFSHLVIMRNGNNGLEYEGEPGALNESFADIMGITVKEYAKGENDWKIGSEIAIYSEAMRNMKEPQEGIALKCPDTYGGEYWVDPEDLNFDYGGVHINSGVQNLWYYLICEGGTGINDLEHAYSVTGIGIDDGVQIAYRNLMYYLTPEANYEDARNGAIQSAIDLYEQDSQAHRSVVDAWYAVGVGKSYAEETGWTDSYSPAQQATKIMRNGQLFIIRNGQTYLINGMEVR